MKEEVFLNFVYVHHVAATYGEALRRDEIASLDIDEEGYTRIHFTHKREPFPVKETPSELFEQMSMDIDRAEMERLYKSEHGLLRCFACYAVGLPHDTTELDLFTRKPWNKLGRNKPNEPDPLA